MCVSWQLISYTVFCSVWQYYSMDVLWFIILDRSSSHSFLFSRLPPLALDALILVAGRLSPLEAVFRCTWRDIPGCICITVLTVTKDSVPQKTSRNISWPVTQERSDSIVSSADRNSKICIDWKRTYSWTLVILEPIKVIFKILSVYIAYLKSDS